MLLKKSYFYILMLMPALSQAADTAQLFIEIPNASAKLQIPSIDRFTQTVDESLKGLTDSFDNFRVAVVESVDKAIQSSHDLLTALKPSGVGTLALFVGLCSADQLFRKYPSKPVAERTHSDWAIPTAGLTASAGTLLYLWSLQQK
jgi:hypothetical protein